MIKIRYSDLQPGLHASAETEGRHTVLYLVPGLTTADRHSAIDRLQASARVGHGPKLPAIPLAAALITDRVKQTTRNAAAAARLHPGGLAVPVIIVTTGAILYALLVSVSMRIGLPGTSYLALGPLPVVTAPPSAASSPQAPAGSRAGGPDRVSRLTGSHAPGRTGHQRAAARPGQTRRPGGPSPRPSSPGFTPNPSPSSGSSPSGTPSPAPTSPSPTSSPRPSPSPSRTGSKGGNGSKGPCLDLGVLNVCV